MIFSSPGFNIKEHIWRPDSEEPTTIDAFPFRNALAASRGASEILRGSQKIPMCGT